MQREPLGDTARCPHCAKVISDAVAVVNTGWEYC